MRKVGTRRVWNFVNDHYGDKIRPGKKHLIYTAIDSIIVDFNDHAFHHQEDLVKVLLDKTLPFFDLSQEVTISVLNLVALYMNECFVAGRKR